MFGVEATRSGCVILEGSRELGKVDTRVDQSPTQRRPPPPQDNLDLRGTTDLVPRAAGTYEPALIDPVRPYFLIGDASPLRVDASA